MTWLEFQTAVKVFLTTDANRLGAVAYVNGLIRQGVLDLENYIQAFRSGFVDTFELADLDTVAELSTGTMPTGGKIIDLYRIKAGHTCCRVPYLPYPGGWENRYDLTCQNARLGEQYWFVISPWGDSFSVFPAIETGYEVEMTWDGVKLDFDDADTLPAVYEDEQAHLAVAEFVKARVAREVKNDLQMATSYRTDYYATRQQLYLRNKDRSTVGQQRKTADPDAVCSVCADGCESLYGSAE